MRKELTLHRYRPVLLIKTATTADRGYVNTKNSPNSIGRHRVIHYRRSAGS